MRTVKFKKGDEVFFGKGDEILRGTIRSIWMDFAPNIGKESSAVSVFYDIISDRGDVSEGVRQEDIRRKAR